MMSERCRQRKNKMSGTLVSDAPFTNVTLVKGVIMDGHIKSAVRLYMEQGRVILVWVLFLLEYQNMILVLCHLIEQPEIKTDVFFLNL